MNDSGPASPLAEKLRFVESRPAVVELSVGEADALIALGNELACTSSWWGALASGESRSVIGVERTRDDAYRVTFRDVIGMVRVGQKHITIEPKIPLKHFSYIASRSEIAPRFSPSRLNVAQGDDFCAVLARWCVDAAERLLRYGLRKDYCDTTDTVEAVRGRIRPLETAVLNASGVPLAACDFQEFSDDTALNRVVKAAAQRISRIDHFASETRNRARQVAFRMDDVGPSTPLDFRAKVDRLSANYATVFPLSLLVLSGLGITLSAGRHIGTAFLVRTPELIEDGLRSILQDGLQRLPVSKRRMMLGDSGISINPDLVFGEGLAIGDVKYRLLGRDWSRSDFNQIVTFATGFRSCAAGLFGFTLEPAPVLPRPVRVGPVNLGAFAWGASDAQAPEQSAIALTAQVEAWLTRAEADLSRLSSANPQRAGR